MTAARPLVVVTGSTGLIGSRVVAGLAADHRVIGLDLREPPREPAGTLFMACDLTRDDSVSAVFERIMRVHGNGIASVIHLAAHQDFSGKPSPLYKELTVEGTRRLLRGLRSLRAEQFVFSSSLLVMKPAEHEGDVLTEKSPVEGSWEYPQSKLEAERVIHEERDDVPAVVLRIAGVYDEGCRSIPIAQQIRRIHEKSFESYVFPGDPSRGQPFVHLDDLVDCFRRVVERRAELPTEETLLVAEPDVMSYAELQEQLGELIHGKEWPTIQVPAPIARAGAWVKEKVAGEEDAFLKPWMIDLAAAHYPVSMAKAQRMLGWTPAHRLRDTLSRMVGKLKEEPRLFYEINGLTAPDAAEHETAGAAKR
jgi:nucleoside-diphosphate-sugar epimerase